MSGIEVKDSGDLRKYRTEVPNLVFELGLSPYALALYMHFKRTAGDDGKCWKSTKRLAEDTNISAGSVSKARRELEEAELIAVAYPTDKTKSITVTITDIWLRNFEHFGEVSRSRKDESKPSRVHQVNATRSSGERRKEPSEEDEDKESSNESSLSSAESPSDGSPPDEEAEEQKDQPKEKPGAFGCRELVERVEAARSRGANIHDPPDIANYGRFFANRFKRHEVETLLWTLDFLVEKASGEITGEPKAWCGFDTALDRVNEGWRPSGAATAENEAERERLRAYDEETERLLAEAEREMRAKPRIRGTVREAS